MGWVVEAIVNRQTDGQMDRPQNKQTHRWPKQEKRINTPTRPIIQTDTFNWRYKQQLWPLWYVSFGVCVACLLLCIKNIKLPSCKTHSHWILHTVTQCRCPVARLLYQRHQLAGMECDGAIAKKTALCSIKRKWVHSSVPSSVWGNSSSIFFIFRLQADLRNVGILQQVFAYKYSSGGSFQAIFNVFIFFCLFSHFDVSVS